jgi:hypothetical protein
LSNEEKTNDYENFEKGMIYMKILKKGGEEETKSMPHAPVMIIIYSVSTFFRLIQYKREGMQLHFHISHHIAHLGWETPVFFTLFTLSTYGTVVSNCF